MTPPSTSLALPELLAPAGSREQLDAALRYGADAVYLGGNTLNLRAASRGFDDSDLINAVNDAHAHNTAVYYCLNILPQQSELATVEARLESLPDTGVDGLIAADPGVIMLARRHCPAIPIHLSTQANTSNSAAVAFWKDLGITRVNVAREVDCHAMKDMVQQHPDMEFEAFVHGAQCLAISGRCLLSAWLNQRSANLGRCTHPCRFDYKGVALKGASLEGATLCVSEKTRPEEVTWEVTEEGQEASRYSSFWAPHDLCLVRFTRWFANIGVAALKIEGRVKSGGYVAQVIDVYRTALDDIARHQHRGQEYIDELIHTASRTLSTGFFLPGAARVSYPYEKSNQHPLVARFEEQNEQGAWRVTVKAPWDASLPATVLLPGMRRPIMEAGTYQLENHRGHKVDKLHPGMTGFVYCSLEGIERGLYIRT